MHPGARTLQKFITRLSTRGDESKSACSQTLIISCSIPIGA
jgi:hypothetical protein